MQHTRENQDRPLSIMNTGQIVIRLGTLIERIQALDAKIELHQATGYNDFKGRHILIDMRDKRKRLQKLVTAAKRRLVQHRNQGLMSA